MYEVLVLNPVGRGGGFGSIREVIGTLREVHIVSLCARGPLTYIVHYTSSQHIACTNFHTLIAIPYVESLEPR